MAEVMWRNHFAKANLYEAFFALIKRIYNTTDAPQFRHVNAHTHKAKILYEWPHDDPSGTIINEEAYGK
jgi:hypothetical protein